MLSVETRALVNEEYYRELLRQADNERLMTHLPARQPLLDRVLNMVVQWLTSRADLLQTAVARCCAPALCC